MEPIDLQPSNRELLAYWQGLRGDRPAPRRFDIEPSAISHILADCFILEVVNPGHYRFRLAGTRMCEHFGREFRGHNLLDFWSPGDREGLQCLLHTVVCDHSLSWFRFHASARNGDGVDFEALVLPLSHTTSAVTRIVGACVATSHPAWLGHQPLLIRELRDHDIVWPDADAPRFVRQTAVPVLRPAGLRAFKGTHAHTPGQMRRHFIVYNGGRKD